MSLSINLRCERWHVTSTSDIGVEYETCWEINSALLLLSLDWTDQAIMGTRVRWKTIENIVYHHRSNDWAEIMWACCSRLNTRCLQNEIAGGVGKTKSENSSTSTFVQVSILRVAHLLYQTHYITQSTKNRRNNSEWWEKKKRQIFLLLHAAHPKLRECPWDLKEENQQWGEQEEEKKLPVRRESELN